MWLESPNLNTFNTFKTFSTFKTSSTKHENILSRLPLSVTNRPVTIHHVTNRQVTVMSLFVTEHGVLAQFGYLGSYMHTSNGPGVYDGVSTGRYRVVYRVVYRLVIYGVSSGVSSGHTRCIEW